MSFKLSLKKLLASPLVEEHRGPEARPDVSPAQEQKGRGVAEQEPSSCRALDGANEELFKQPGDGD